MSEAGIACESFAHSNDTVCLGFVCSYKIVFLLACSLFLTFVRIQAGVSPKTGRVFKDL